MKDTKYDFYAASACGYDELYGKEQQNKLEHITSFLESEDIEITGKILDVGCGSGISSDYFGCSTGIDPCEELLQIAKDKYPDIEFIKAFAEKIPFNDDFFDFSVSITAAQNFSDMRKAIIEMNRVSKKGFLITILKNSPKRDVLETEIENISAGKFKIMHSEHVKDAIFVIIK